jgi:hypothetical protein
MSTETEIIGIPSDVLADGDAVIESIITGRPLDEKTAKRIEERAARITAAIYQNHGYLDVAVPSIRELRDS